MYRRNSEKIPIDLLKNSLKNVTFQRRMLQKRFRKSQTTSFDGNFKLCDFILRFRWVRLLSLFKKYKLANDPSKTSFSEISENETRKILHIVFHHKKIFPVDLLI
jgi:hypothetical protein